MPVALDIIENKLKRREFPTLTTLESLFKRMITNAKEYNEKGSEVYDDSERLRKVLSHFMNKNNPAYDIPGYVAFPTPLPGTTNDEGSEKDADGEPDPEVESLPRRKASRPSRQSGAQAPRSSITPSRSEIQYVGVGFNGLNFQQAQEKILEEIITKKELEGFATTIFYYYSITNSIGTIFRLLSHSWNYHQDLTTETTIRLSHTQSV